MVSVDKIVSLNPHDLVEFYSCDSSNQSCMEGSYSACSVAINLDIIERNLSTFSVFQWKNVEKKSRKISVHLNYTELINEFNTHISTLKKHIFVKRCQINYYNSLGNF